MSEKVLKVKVLWESGGFVLFSLSYFIFLRRRTDPLDESDCSQMVFMSSLIGRRLKFQTDRSPLAESGGLCKMSNGWINRGNEKMDKRQDVNDSPLFPQTVLFS